MSYALVATPAFTRRLRRFVRRHPDLGDRLERVLHDLEHDPFQPHLRLHALRGSLQGFQAVRLTRSFRVVVTVRVPERQVVLHDLGAHDDVYGR